MTFSTQATERARRLSARTLATPFFLAGPALLTLLSNEALAQDNSNATASTETTAASSSKDPIKENSTDDQEVFITKEKTASSASEVEVSASELMIRPRREPGAIVEAAPGLISVQHAGGGKANQYFLRGFDIDHGTDLSFSIDRMPINMPSHGHGQGYADLHFIIPETLSEVKVHKGTYYAPFGDFATAGALEMETADRLPEGRVAFTLGQYGVVRGLGIVSERLSERTGVLLAGEVYAQNGPFENPEKLKRFNLLGKITHDLSPTTSTSLTWMSYSGKWNASGQIPVREVEAGNIDQFGYIDPTEGGATQRHSLSLGVKSQFDDVSLEANIYGIIYDWRLYSNFTFFLEDRINGDQIEQTDKRGVLGTDMRVHWKNELSWVRLKTTAGIQARHDGINNALYHDAQRERLSTTVKDNISQSSLAFYVDEEARFFPWLAFRGGLRADYMQVDVEDRLASNSTSNGGNGGIEAQLLFSPKASLILSPLDWLDMFVNFGRGFHSNDARGATRASDPADLLAAATGYEIGASLSFWRPLNLTLVTYRLDLQSEQVYVGDAGTTEASDASTRYGIESTAKLRLNRIFSADAALTLNRAEYRPNEGNGGSVALAPTRTFSGGVSANAPFGSFAALRVRHIGKRAATEDGSIEAQGWTVASASVGHRQGPFELRVDIENLFNSTWREVQFATESQLQNESQPVEEIHFAPGWPFNARATLSAYF